MDKISEIQNAVNNKFDDVFGRTPLNERLKDIFRCSMGVKNAFDAKSLDEKTGDLLCAVIQLCNEQGWDISRKITNTLDKIERRRLQYKSLGRRIKVALLGGAFNPPTKGHIELAQFVLDVSGAFDEVWLVPCYQHMNSKQMQSSDHRLNMCEIACEKDRRIKVCDYEIMQKFKGETYHFLKHLLQEDFSDKYEFSMIMGQDNANTFENWVNFEFLEKLLPFVIVPRKGVNLNINSTWYLRPPHMYLCGEYQLRECSSTEIRNFLKETSEYNQCPENLDENVFKYIKDRKLYEKI